MWWRPSMVGDNETNQVDGLNLLPKVLLRKKYIRWLYSFVDFMSTFSKVKVKII